MQQDIIKFCCEATGQDGETVSSVANALLSYLCNEFEKGHSVDFGQDFGVFLVKRREQIFAAGGLRGRKATEAMWSSLMAGSNLRED